MCRTDTSPMEEALGSRQQIRGSYETAPSPWTFSGMVLPLNMYYVPRPCARCSRVDRECAKRSQLSGREGQVHSQGCYAIIVTGSRSNTPSKEVLRRHFQRCSYAYMLNEGLLGGQGGVRETPGPGGWEGSHTGTGAEPGGELVRETILTSR